MEKLRKQMENQVLKTKDGYHYFFDSFGIYRIIAKENASKHKLVNSETTRLMKEVFGKQLDTKDIEMMISRLKPGDTVEKLEASINPEKYLAYRVLRKEHELYFYFDHEGSFKVSTYVPALVYACELNKLIEEMFNFEQNIVTNKLLQSVVINMKTGDKIQDFKADLKLAIKDKKKKFPYKLKKWFYGN